MTSMKIERLETAVQRECLFKLTNRISRFRNCSIHFIDTTRDKDESTNSTLFRMWKKNMLDLIFARVRLGEGGRLSEGTNVVGLSK